MVDNWGRGGSGDLRIDQGHLDGQRFSNNDDPVSSTQFALSRGSGYSEQMVTMDLTYSANLALKSFRYTDRGNFPPRLTVEYFALNEAPLGTDVYTLGDNGGSGVGLNTAFNPDFQLITPSAPVLGVPLSKLAFTTERINDPANGGGHFTIDDILFSVIPEPSSLALLSLVGVGLLGW